MASITRYQNPPLIEALKNEPYSFDFDQAVVILEQLQKLFPENSKGIIPLGDSSELTQEALTIKSHVSFSMPASELQKLDIVNKPILWINFLGLAGALGPLPTPYTEMVVERTRMKDTGFRDFLDIFNHRMASMWHRLHKKTNVGIAQVLPENSFFGECLLRLSGLCSEKDIDKTGLSQKALLTYQNLFWKQPHSSMGLSQLISHQFNVKAQVRDFQGAWRRVDMDEVSRIGVSEGQWNKLGQTSILGSRCWDQMAGIHIDISCLTWDKFCSFLPINFFNKKIFMFFFVICANRMLDWNIQ